MTANSNLVPITVKADGVNATRTDIRAGRNDEFLLVSDEPPERHGNNEGMLPLQAFLAGYVACSNVIMNIIAKELGITFSGLEFAATGHLDPRGYMGLKNIAAPFAKVHLKISGEVRGNVDQIETLKSQLQWRCPAAATIRSSGTEVSETWDLKSL